MTPDQSPGTTEGVNGLIDSIRRVKQTFRPLNTEDQTGPSVELEGQKILVVYLFEAVGDAVLLGPVLKALLNGGAKGPIGVLVRANAARTLRLLNLPLKLHVLPDILHMPAPSDPESKKAWQDLEVRNEVAELTDALVAKKYTIAVDLTHRTSVDSRRWLEACGAETRLGWVDRGTSHADAGLTWGTEDVRVMADRHWSKYMTLPLRCLGLRQPDYELEFTISDAAKAKAKALFGRGPKLLLVPGARDPNKRWDPESFERVGQWMCQEAEGSVVVVGAPAEAKLIRSLVKSIGDGAVAYTQKDLGTLVALVQAADVVVTNDTGPMHFAFLCKTPTVAIFTWMSPLCWGPPVTDPRFIVLRTPDDAAPDAEGIYTRAAIHYLDGLLAKFGPTSASR